MAMPTPSEHETVKARFNIPKMGSNMPNMGMKAKAPPVPRCAGLADALLTATRQRVLLVSQAR